MAKPSKRLRAALLWLPRRLRRLTAPWRHRARARALLAHIVTLASREPSVAIAAPFVTLISPVYNAPPHYLDALVASVRGQRGGGWELILSDDGSTSRETRAWLDAHAGDGDFKILRGERNQGVVGASNAAIEAASAPWIGFLDHDDALAPHALERIYVALAANPACEFLYTDEVIADARMRVTDIFFKPGFDPVLLSGVNYLNHFSLYRRARVLEIGGLRPGFEGSQDYDLVLRYTRGLQPPQILHLPYPAYVWRRDGGSFSVKHIERATRSAQRALAETFAVETRAVGAVEGGLHRLAFGPRGGAWPLVSVVIPSRDSYPLIERVLEGLCEKTDYPALEILVIDNGTTDPRVLALYEKRRLAAPRFEAIVEPESFNFARAVNKGVARATGEFVLLLNNDIEILHPDWLKEMVECFAYADVGVVGAKLLYPDETLQHAGVIVGFGGLAGHWYLKMARSFPGPMGRLRVRQSLSSVTGACFLVSRACLDAVGPFDEARFAIAYNDIDFCLRAREAGFRVVWTPFATLKHHESASRGSDETDANRPRFLREQENLRRRHATDRYDDFAISPWFTKDRSCPEWRRLERLPPAR